MIFALAPCRRTTRSDPARRPGLAWRPDSEAVRGVVAGRAGGEAVPTLMPAGPAGENPPGRRTYLNARRSAHLPQPQPRAWGRAGLQPASTEGTVGCARCRQARKHEDSLVSCSAQARGGPRRRDASTVSRWRPADPCVHSGVMPGRNLRPCERLEARLVPSRVARAGHGNRAEM
jgi:hypothetical protein